MSNQFHSVVYQKCSKQLFKWLQFKAYKPKTYLLYGYWITIRYRSMKKVIANEKTKITFRMRKAHCVGFGRNLKQTLVVVLIISVDSNVSVCVFFSVSFVEFQLVLDDYVPNTSHFSFIKYSLRPRLVVNFLLSHNFPAQFRSVR